MLKMIKGCNVHNNEQLQEEYERDEFVLTANVNRDKICEVIKDFIKMQNSLIFFILELPANENEEKQLRKDDFAAMHKDIYYIDGLSSEKALILLEEYSDILINDGLSCFGFGLQDNTAEIMVKKYNVVTLWSSTLEKYNGFFESHNIHQKDHIVTAWDTFNNETPGESFLYKCNGMSVYSLIDELKKWGIYLWE